MRILLTAGAVALAVSLAFLQGQTSGIERLELKDVDQMQGGGCVTNKNYNVDKVKMGSYYFSYSQTYLITCIRIDASASFFYYCNGSTITQDQWSTGTVQCGTDPNHPTAPAYLTAVSGWLNSFNLTRVYGGLCGNLASGC